MRRMEWRTAVSWSTVDPGLETPVGAAGGLAETVPPNPVVSNFDFLVTSINGVLSLDNILWVLEKLDCLSRWEELLQLRAATRRCGWKCCIPPVNQTIFRNCNGFYNCIQK